MATIPYDPTKVTLCVFGENITELGSSPITLTFNSDYITHTAGMQGDHAVTKNPDRSAILSFSLQQNARLNGVLAGFLAAADEDEVWPEFPCTLNDPSSPFLPIMKDCSLRKPPAVSYGMEQADVTWEIFVKDCKLVPKDQAGTSVVSIVATANSMYEGYKKIADLFK